MSETKSVMSESYRREVIQLIRKELASYEKQLLAWNADRQMQGVLRTHKDYLDFINVTLRDEQSESSESQSTEEEPASEFHPMD